MRKNKINEIPKNTQYCYGCSGMDKYGHLISYKECPYFKYRKTNFGFGGKKTNAEYCKYLKKYLSIQDQVKDCGLFEPNWFYED